MSSETILFLSLAIIISALTKTCDIFAQTKYTYISYGYKDRVGG